MKLVSVIVPVYKVEPYLESCFDSILCQSYKNFELIAVDDGSPDKCGEICDEYARKDSRIKVIHQRNGGLSAARNAAIDIAIGDYLTFVDSDDFVFPEYLERLVSLCDKYDADMSVCGYTRCAFSDTPNTMAYKQEGEKEEYFSEDRMKIFFSTKKINTVAWGKLYDRKIFDRLRYPVGKYNEDIFTTYLAVDLAKKIAVSDYIGYAYRQNENSIINEVYSKRKWDSVEGSLIRAEFIKSHYPELKKYAEMEIVYNCNRILISMARSGVRDLSALNKMQELYRIYARSYVFGKCALLGKVFALLSVVNVKWTFLLAKKLRF